MEYKKMKQWVKALRSGKYKQGTEVLQDSDGSFCCLGVLCKLEGNFYNGTSHYNGPSLKSNDGTLSKPYKKKNGGITRSLIGLNDGGLSFKQIARIIEKNYKEL